MIDLKADNNLLFREDLQKVLGHFQEHKVKDKYQLGQTPESQQKLEAQLANTSQKYVNTTIECKLHHIIYQLEFFGHNTGICTCCAQSIKGQQDKVISYKYPKCVSTLYRQDFQKDSFLNGVEKQKVFNIEKEKQNLKIKQDQKLTMRSTFQQDFKPFATRSVQKSDQDKAYEQKPQFINSSSYGKNFVNWGTKPFERVREIRKMPFDSHFKGQSTYYLNFNKAEGQKLPPKFEREYDEKFYNDLKRRNQKGEYAGLLSSPFLAKSTSHEAFKKTYNIPKPEPQQPIQEVLYKY